MDIKFLFLSWKACFHLFIRLFKDLNLSPTLMAFHKYILSCNHIEIKVVFSHAVSFEELKGEESNI